MRTIALLLHTARDEFDFYRTVRCRKALSYYQKLFLQMMCEVVQETQWHFDKHEWVSRAVTRFDSEGVCVTCTTFYVRDAWMGRIRLQTVAGDSALLLEESVECSSFLRHVVDTCLVEAAWQHLKRVGTAVAPVALN